MGHKHTQFREILKNTLVGSLIRVLRQKPFYPSHFCVLMGDLYSWSCQRPKDPHDFCGEAPSSDHNLLHLKAAMDWLSHAHDVNNDGGISSLYSFSKGWGASYPETTGYIIPTFFDYHNFSAQNEYKQRAIRMANWLISIQSPNGAFPGLQVDQPTPKPSVFNTGQIMFGLMRTYKETSKNSYLNSAIKSANWLVSVQDHDGAWRRFSYNNIQHTYYTRVVWPLLELYQLTLKQSYKQAAINNLEWVLNNQKETGWYLHNSFDMRSNPYTHNIIYAARGMLESGALLNHPPYVKSAERVCNTLFRKFEIRKFLPGDLSEDWKGHNRYSCLTGNAQLSVLLMRLYQLKGDARFLNTALKINEYLRTTQHLRSNNRGIRGGIKGSKPIWGNYHCYSYPCWAVKFFVDALLLEERIFTDLGEGR